jgi:apoptosis-inducing factor 3
MGGKPKALEGPDLRKGVLLELLEEERPFLGHAGGEAVVLVRRGAEVFAVGASCPHYHGPLAEGLVVDEGIRCPWHHACFSLRTGEARAPALDPIATWEVRLVEGMAFVGQKREPPPLDPRGRVAAGPESVVIVGAGAAGSAAAEMLRREGYAGPVLLVDPEAEAPYDRPNLSKDYLAGKAKESWIPLRPEGFYAEHDIERVVTSAVALSPGARTLSLADGRVVRFGALLLATGADPIRLPLPGAELPHVHVLRSFADCRAIIRRAEQAAHAVVIGASFIGMEAAAALRARGLEVTVLAPDEVPFERTLGQELGRHLQRAHERNGVRFRLGRKPAEILAERVRLDDGSELPAQLVVVGVGVRPSVRLAEDAGLEVDGGVLVDEYLRTSAPGVFAAGDIARWPDPRTGDRIRVEHWVVAQRQGQTAARNILGARESFVDIPFFWTRQYDDAIAYVGHAAKWDRIEVEGDVAAGDCAVRYRVGDRLLAVATMGRDQESLRLEAAMVATMGRDQESLRLEAAMERRGVATAGELPHTSQGGVN